MGLSVPGGYLCVPCRCSVAALAVNTLRRYIERYVEPTKRIECGRSGATVV